MFIFELINLTIFKNLLPLRFDNHIESNNNTLLDKN